MNRDLPLTQQRMAWVLLATSGLGLELAALWFQYGMELDPCVLCIYQRVAVMGLLAAGLIGTLLPQLAFMRWVAYLLWGISAGWGLLLALELVGFEVGDTPTLGCSFAPDFPSWAKLDEWWPEVFVPTGMCGDVQWQFLSLSMANWMVVVFSVYLLILAGVLYLEVRQRR